MSTTDKTLLSICILSLAAGLFQHGCTKRMIEKKEAGLAAKSPSRTNSVSATNSADSGETPVPTFVHIVDDEPVESMPKSEHQQHLEAIRKHIESLDEQKPVKLSEDFDLFAAREGLKDMLFSPTFDNDCGTNTMTDAEKWEFIEAGNLPW